MKIKLIEYSDWEQLVELMEDGSERILVEGHRLSAEDALFAVGFRFEIEEEDEVYYEADEDYCEDDEDYYEFADYDYDPFTGQCDWD